ncbi:bifunctional riboflavin kinase/FAD synthetase [Cryomorphaceae bacterium 1068]|nr:bifunctional riboflavin kinase/FAD synthetase [Cryomorphaceae bacterium 1068]
MEVYHDVADFHPTSGTIVTVGTFDGVHIGHKTIINRINELAKNQNGESVLLTFWPHPRLVLFPDDNELKLLSTLRERIELLRESGIDHLIIHPFSVDFSRITAVEYVRDILVRDLNVSKLVIGYDHHFGRNREGNLEELKSVAPDYGFEVEEISAQEIDDVNVSSTKIRNALLDGDLAKANEFLGYRYSVSGKVIKGQEIGRSIGFPTANLEPDESYKLIPGNGVYSVAVDYDGRIYRGMANLGNRPTVSDSEDRILEVNLFEFDGDLYEKEIKVTFVDRIRDEIKFESLEQLRAQLQKDATVAGRHLDDLSDHDIIY